MEKISRAHRSARRIAYVERLLRETGVPPVLARRRAVLAYTAYLGHAQLLHTTPGVLPSTSRERGELADEMAALLLFTDVPDGN